MKINIYHHFVQDCDEKKQLDRIERKIDQILDLIDGGNDEALRQQIMDKLNALKIDIEGTIS